MEKLSQWEILKESRFLELVTSHMEHSVFQSNSDRDPEGDPCHSEDDSLQPVADEIETSSKSSIC
jgi:hypothetical protein